MAIAVHRAGSQFPCTILNFPENSHNDRYTTEIVANEMQMLGGGRGGTARLDNGPSHEGAAAPATSTATADAGGEGFDDDIPF